MEGIRLDFHEGLWPVEAHGAFSALRVSSKSKRAHSNLGFKSLVLSRDEIRIDALGKAAPASHALEVATQAPQPDMEPKFLQGAFR